MVGTDSSELETQPGSMALEQQTDRASSVEVPSVEALSVEESPAQTPFVETPSVEEPIGETSSSELPDSLSQPILRRHSTLEAGRQISNTDITDRKLRILQEAFGANAMAHKELRVDVFTAFTELTILIKLLTIRGASWFTVRCLFLVLGWFAVQILLILTHLQGMNEQKLTASFRVARALNSKLKEQATTWLWLFAILHLPFFGYPAYLAAFRPWFSKNALGFPGLFRYLGTILSKISAMATMCAASLGFLYVYENGDQLFDGVKGWFLWCLLSAFLCMWLFVSSVSFLAQPCDGNASSICSQFTPAFAPNTTLNYVVDQSFEKVYQGVWLLIFLALISAVYFSITLEGDNDDNKTVHSSASSRRKPLSSPSMQKRSSFGNVVFVLIAFVLYLVWYDSSKTYKPTWIDILG